ncbi:DsbE family thiol:disulfide interchange protein [Shimia sp.]|uniref:DsbE family thiol:disulfide interchange protein n=1 Tax=Shimia sp. TaxID=1954381 RepID=UPI00356AEA4B
MARVSPLMIAPPLLFAALAALFFFGMARDNPNELPSALTGRQAPALAVAPLGDLPGIDPAILTDGEIKLVNFWASWCAPCRVEHPTLMQLKAEGLAIYGVNYKDKPANGLGFLAELGDPYRAVGQDSSGRVGIDWGVYGVPETYLLDGSGKIITRIAGPLTQRELEGRLRPKLRALREAAPGS